MPDCEKMDNARVHNANQQQPCYNAHALHGVNDLNNVQLI